ncbi:MAG: RidA family protein [Pseudomonadota bacterium]
MTGQVAWDSDHKVVGEADCEAQARHCFDNVAAILSAVGGRMEDIVSLTIFYVDPVDLPAIQKVRAERVSLGHGPVSILIQAAGLVSPELLVEVIPVAVIPDHRFVEPTFESAHDGGENG